MHDLSGLGVFMASGTNFGPGLLLLSAMFPAAIFAALIGWVALRQTPPWRTALVFAFVILLSPFALGTVLVDDPMEGLSLALAISSWTVIAPAVGIGLVVATFLKYQSMRYDVARYTAFPEMHRLVSLDVLKAGRDKAIGQLQVAADEPAADAFDRRLQVAEYDVALGETEAAAGSFRAAVSPGIAGLAQADAHRFLQILFVTLAFGTRAERDHVAQEWMRRGATVSADTTTALADGLVQLVLGRPLVARGRLLGVCIAERRLVLAAAAGAAIALIDQDEALFERHLMAALQEHRKRYRKLPADPAGAVNVLALALCRMARDAGAAVHDRPYLPIALLPRSVA